MKRIRNGSMLLEVTLSVMMLTIALVAVAHLLALAGRQRHESRWRAVATREVANVTEQVMVLPWAETTDDQVRGLTLHPITRDMLNEPNLMIDVTEVSEPRRGKRIRVTLQYRNTSGLQVEPIAMVAWKFSPGGAE